MYVDLGHIFEWGFNLASKKFAFLFERALLHVTCIQYMPQWKTFKQYMTNVVAPSDFTWIYLTGFAKTWL